MVEWGWGRSGPGGSLESGRVGVGGSEGGRSGCDWGCMWNMLGGGCGVVGDDHGCDWWVVGGGLAEGPGCDPTAYHTGLCKGGVGGGMVVVGVARTCCGVG